MNHLDTLQLRLSNERVRLQNATTDKERNLRRVWVAQIEKEIAAERGFEEPTKPMTDEELLSQLTTS